MIDYPLYENCYNALKEWLDYIKDNDNYVQELSAPHRKYLSFRTLISQQNLDYLYTAWAAAKCIEEQQAAEDLNEY